ncbi:MAG: mRNA surveillance protein pelota [Candidatus Micrarchaeota archaeon]
MRVVKLDRREGLLVAEPESIEDLWYLTKILEAGDLVTGRSFRRFKPTGGIQATSGEKKLVKVQIRLENAEFAEQANKLRLTGPIVAGTPEEYCPHGEFHTLDVEPHQRVEVAKHLNAFHEAVLEEAKQRSVQARALVAVMDEEKALFAELQARGIKFGPRLHCHANKRDPQQFEEKRKQFFAEATEVLKQKIPAEGGLQAIVAGPGFTKDEFKKFLSTKEPKLAKSVSWEHANSAEETGVYELLKKGVLERILGEQKLQEEYAALEKLKASLGREDGLSAYGLDDVRSAVESGAAAQLLVLDELVRKNKEALRLLERARQYGTRVTIFNSDDDAGAEFKAFKIAALLRYRVAR